MIEILSDSKNRACLIGAEIKDRGIYCLAACFVEALPPETILDFGGISCPLPPKFADLPGLGRQFKIFLPFSPAI
jgi:hypothetical protein